MDGKQMTTSILNRSFSGPFLIGLAAFLWATDALFRYPTINSVDPTFVVFVEHLLAVLVMFPFIYFRYRKQLFSLTAREWLAAAFCGVGGSAFAFVFFTASFLYVNPSVSILLQKLQPVMVVMIAYLFLGERPAKKFYIWGSIALFAGIILSFPDLNFKFISDGVDLHSKGIQYAFFAALIWAASTVGGKILVKRIPPVLATFWRFFFGFVALCILMFLAKDPISWTSLQSGTTLMSLAYISLIPGLVAMIAYYSGLAQTTASVTTFVELFYPIGAVLLNTIFLHTTLDVTQTVAGAILLIAVTLVSI